MTFRDRYEEALLAHLKAKQAGTVQERKPRFAAPHRVINLLETLRRSVAEDKKTRRVAQGGGPGAQTGVSVMAPRAAMSRPSRVTDSRPHERTR